METSSRDVCGDPQGSVLGPSQLDFLGGGVPKILHISIVFDGVGGSGKQRRLGLSTRSALKTHMVLQGSVRSC